MCVGFGKSIEDWLRNDDTIDFLMNFSATMYDRLFDRENEELLVRVTASFEQNPEATADYNSGIMMTIGNKAYDEEEVKRRVLLFVMYEEGECLYAHPSITINIAKWIANS